jgi:hypothetical protein
MSDRKIDASKRRDIRRDKPLDEPVKVPAKSKNTKRWCKGKVGVEHKPRCVKSKSGSNNPENYSFHWRDLVCIQCGKVLDCYWPIRWRESSKPTWVDC